MRLCVLLSVRVCGALLGTFERETLFAIYFIDPVSIFTLGFLPSSLGTPSGSDLK